ncbi:M23 family metallopeptidase [Candidatus Falkowbacteria bacterium]|nr:M23 family metallopeptidase [Candidatus Falkowbacteria bacterium]
MALNKIFNKKTIISIIVLKAMISLIILIGFAASNANATYGIDKSIKQVKTADSPVIYYLDHKHGMKKSYVSEAAFLAYGNKWSDVKIIGQKELDKWPEVYLIKTSDDSKVYYINNGKKAWIESEQQFIDLGFNWNDIATVAKADLDSYQLTNYNQLKIAAASSDDNSEGLLSASLDSSSPAQTYIPTMSRGNTVAVFKLAAAEKEVKINKLTLTRIGVTSDSNIDGVYLEGESGEMYGYKVGAANKQAYINFGSEPITIAAGQSKTISVKVDLESVSDVVGQTLGFEILNSVDIDSEAQISGNFPIKGAEHKLINGTDNLGQLKVSSNALNSSAENAEIGAEEESITSFRFSETSGKENILIRKIILTNEGSAWDSDIKNIRLIDGNGKSAAKTEALQSKKATFNFANGYELKKSHYADFTVKLDIVGGDGHDIKFVIKNSDDISAVGAENNYGLVVKSDESFPVGGSCSECDKITISRGSVSIAAAGLDKDDLKIYRDENDAVLGEFELRNGSSDIKIDSFDVSITASSDAPELDAVVYLKDKSGEEISSIDGKNITNASEQIRLNGYQAGARKNFKFSFVSHIPDTAPSGATYEVQIKNVNYYIGADNQLYTDALNAAGQTMQVIEPSLYLYAGEFSDKDAFAAGDTKVNIAVFKVEASSDEKIKIESIIISNASGYTPATYTNGFSNLTLYRGGSKIGSAIERPTASSNTFNNLKLTVSAGKSVDLYVKADLASNAAGEVRMVLENISAKGYTTGAPVLINNKGAQSPTATITKTELKITATGGGSASTNTKNNEIASFTFTNEASETIKLNKVTVTASGNGLSKSEGFTNLRFGYESNGKIKQVGSKVSSPVSGSNEVSLGGYKLEAGASVTLNIYVDAGENIDSGSVGLYLQNIKAKGAVSGVEIADGVTDSVTVTIGGGGSGSASVILEWPTSSHSVSYYFHDDNYPYADEFEHSGIDIDVSQGTEVEAAASGSVSAVYDGGDDGTSYVMIEHDNGLTTVYEHLSEIYATAGQSVTDDMVIGLSGGEPGTQGAGEYTTGAHLHFEVRLNGTPIDPMTYLE